MENEDDVKDATPVASGNKSRAMTAEQARQRLTDMVREVSAEVAEEIRANVAKSLEAVRATEVKVSASTKALEEYLALQERRDKKQEIVKGEFAGGFVRVLAQSRKDMIHPVELARKQYGDEHPITKALTASSATGGGFLIEGEFANEVIELLYAAEVIEASGPTRVPLDRGSITLPKMTAGAAGGWLGEGSNLAHTAQTFGQVTLTARKYGSLVAISNDLLRYATPSVDRLVRADMVRDISGAEDLAFLRGDGTAAQPKGLRNINGISTNAQSGTALADMTNDTGLAIQTLLDSNVSISESATWFWAPRTWKAFATVRDGNGNLAFQPELNSGTLWGYRWKRTTQIPTNLVSNQSETYFVNMPDVIVGRASSIEVDASADAAYHNGSAVVAAFSLDQTVVRAITRVDINVRYPASVYVITGVTVGA